MLAPAGEIPVKWRVLITCPAVQQSIDRYRERFAAQDVEIELPPVVQQLKESELLEIIDRYDGMIAGDDEVTAGVLKKGKRLRVISKWGVGLDAIDLKAAQESGIHVFNTPDVFGDEVADVVIGYIVMLARQLHKIDQIVRNGKWLKIQGRSLRDKVLGIVGLGSIGQALVRRATALGMSVHGIDPVPIPHSLVEGTGLRLVQWEELLEHSDFISLNCNLTITNRHMIGSREFALMKSGVCLINTARGALIDEIALVEALETGKVGGAALDVFEQEPLPAESPLRGFENCILGTHNSSNALEAVLRVNELAIANLIKGLES
jgi:D-3-phosphoglycerate dehydrogenase